jgi:hypothetical protein
MDLVNEKIIWVCVEFVREHDNGMLRGTMLESDFNNIIDGQFSKKFVEINNTHWAEKVKNLQDGTTGIKIIAFGRDMEWKWHTGAYLINVERIFAIAILNDVSNLVSSDYKFIW